MLRRGTHPARGYYGCQSWSCRHLVKIYRPADRHRVARLCRRVRRIHRDRRSRQVLQARRNHPVRRIRRLVRPLETQAPAPRHRRPVHRAAVRTRSAAAAKMHLPAGLLASPCLNSRSPEMLHSHSLNPRPDSPPAPQRQDLPKSDSPYSGSESDFESRLVAGHRRSVAPSPAAALIPVKNPEKEGDFRW